MKRFLLVFFLFMLLVLTSCISYQDTLYVQDKNAKIDSLQAVIEMQKPYRVQISDILNIRVKALDQENVQIFNPLGNKELTASSVEKSYFDGFTVDVHGNIRIPTLGKINVLGFTTEEIEQILERKLLEEEFKETANLFVTVKLTGLKYTTTGEIGETGTKVLFQERVNILEAIANSGDIPVTGNKKDVLIIRQYPHGQKIHHLDLTDVNVMKSPYYYIQPNDLIYVKPLKQKAWGTGTNVLQDIGAIATVLSLITTTVLLFQRI